MSATDNIRRGIVNLFSRNMSRRQAAMSGINWIMKRILQAYSSRHIASGRRQLAVFSYDLIGHWINIDGVFENEELVTFFEWMKPYRETFSNACAIDVGANIGNHSLYFSDFFSSVISIEPNKRAFALLRVNADMVSNMTCHNFGVSSEAGEAKLIFGADNVGGARISPSTSCLAGERIPLRTLDSVASHVENIKLVKIDVEGHEYQVLLGATEVIRKNRPIIIFEQLKSEFGAGTTPVIDLLAKSGYSRFAIVQKHPVPPIWAHRYIGYVYSAIVSVVWGASMRVTIRGKISHASYAFIVALPEWVAINTHVRR